MIVRSDKFTPRILFLGFLFFTSLQGMAIGGTAVAISSNGFFGWCRNGGPVETASAKAIENCQKSGGVNPQVVASTFTSSHGAIAKSGSGSQAIFGWSVGIVQRSRASRDEALEDAKSAAIALCKKRGGTDPKIVASW